MKLQVLKVLFFIAAYMFGAQIVTSQAYGQETTVTKEKELVRITMKDRSTKTGYILSDDGREVLLDSKEVGHIYLDKNDIISITKIEAEEIEDKYDPVNPPTSFNTRYHFTTNSFPVKKNENYAAFNLYGPEVHFSPIDNLSVGIMASWVATPIVLALKYTIPTNNENINFGLGTLFGTSGYLNAFNNLGGLHWAMVTFGKTDINLTLSAGISYFDIDGISNNEASYQPVIGTYFFPTGSPEILPYEFVKKKALVAPAFSIGFAAKISRTATFIIDGMLFVNKRTDTYPNIQSQTDITGNTVTVTATELKQQLLYLMPGLRFQSRPSFAFQFSLAGVSIFNSQNQNQSFPIPMATWFLRF